MAKYQRTANPVVEAICYGGEYDIFRFMNWIVQHKVSIAGWKFHSSEITTDTGLEIEEDDFVVLTDTGAIEVYPEDVFHKRFETYLEPRKDALTRDQYNREIDKLDSTPNGA